MSPDSASPYELYCGQNSCISYNDNHEQVVQARNILSSGDKYHEIEYSDSDYVLSESKNKTDLSKQVMGESTNTLNPRNTVETNKQDLQKENGQHLSSRPENYYKTSPLNVIQEKWEQESRASIQNDPYSAKGATQSVNLTTNSQCNSQKKRKSSKIEKQNKSKVSSNAKGSEIDQTNNKSRIQEKKEKVEAIKNRIKQLFLNYCDFSVDNGNIFITNTGFFKLLKDAKILDSQTVTLNNVSILLTKECNTNCNLIKNITFEQFLNVILMISQLKFPEMYAKHPKKALQKLLVDHVLPLLDNIEMAVLQQKEEQIHSLYSVSELTLKLIIFNKDTQVLFQDVLPIFKKIYEAYFEQEIACQKGKCQDLMKVSLKSVINFARDFELCPYLIHQKACFLIWYSVAYSTSIPELCNNVNQKIILPNSQNSGKSFTLGHFIIFFYRLAVVYFNHQSDKAQEFNLVKKLLFFLRKLENSDGFKKFMKKLNRTYNENFTFLPSKDLLLQILKAEGLDNKFINSNDEIDFISKEAMISRIVDPFQNNIFLEEEEMPDNVEIQEECDTYLQNCDEELRKLFQIYCSFGDPMNTKYLKSSKMVKLIRECGLLKGQSNLPKLPNKKRVKQISLVDLDLAFKKICVPKPFASPVRDNLTSMMSLGASIDQSHQISMNLLQQSMMSSRLGLKFQGNYTATNQNSFNKTFNFDNHSHLTDKFTQNLKLDFNQFKSLVEQLSIKMIPDFPPSLAFVEVIKTFLLPHLNTLSDKRCVHNSKIQKLLSTLDSEEVITILTVLHKSILDIYKIYADKKKHMNFNQFMQFCTDYDVFPYLISKPALYRIFHSLSFINEFISNENTFNKTFSPIKSQTSRLSMLKSRIETPKGTTQQCEIIDEHLFVEALALCALYKGDELEEEDGDKNEIGEGDTNEQTNVEMILEFIEKIANSEGINKKMKNQRERGNSLKCNLLEKKDILEPFRIKYGWYFRQKYYNSEKKKNFEDVMEMSSVWTNSSQIL